MIDLLISVYSFRWVPWPIWVALAIVGALLAAWAVATRAGQVMAMRDRQVPCRDNEEVL